MNKPADLPGDKFRRYRARKRAQGLREVRLWAPDLRDPEILARIRREGALLRGRPEEEEALDIIEAELVETMKDLD